MGLFWSLRQAPGQRRGLRLMKRDPRQPFVIEINVLSGHWNIDLDTADHPQTLATKTVNRLYASRDVTSYDVRAGVLRGRLYLPPG
jgi:Acyl-CoA thioester hydrolase/BAAT N-terminal region